MAWDNLAKRFKQMPLLLAGPILRHVTTKSVTVWVATLRSCEVTLTVYASGGPAPLKVAEGVRTTTQIGKNLHILAITASPLGSTVLSPGTLYLYDLKFLDMGIAIVSLQEALDRPVDPASPPDLTTDPFTLGYGSLGMPSFSLPPSDPNKIRIMQQPCRRAHGEAGDALTILDDLISATASKPDERPHQLYLTGDQIYADDVADSLLLMLTDAGDTLLGWTETLPSIPPFLPPGPAAKLPPYSREKYLKAVGFTSEDLRSHLMSLGEYLAMYLFAWSDALWPTNSPNPVDTVPTFLDIVASVHDQGDHDDLVSTIVDREKIIRKDISNLRTFRDSLPQVRKALANIPTYMICDDHEVTDDWNMTREFCEDVYGHDFGVRIMQNALVAFALCQAWGNQPDQFDPTIRIPTPPIIPPGARLLQLFGNYEGNSDEIRNIVGVHTTPELKADEQKNGTFRMFHEGLPLRYNFIIDWPAFVVIVSDTRSWRSFPEPGDKTQPDMLGPGELANQLTIPATDKPKIVVFTTNAPPIRAMRKIVKHPKIAGVYDSDLYDSWQYPSRHFDQMIVQLTSMCPATKVNILGQLIDKVQGQVMILSGDYHYSFASRMDYWATSPLGHHQTGHAGGWTTGFEPLPQRIEEHERTPGRRLHVYGALVPKDWNAERRPGGICRLEHDWFGIEESGKGKRARGVCDRNQEPGI